MSRNLVLDFPQFFSGIPSEHSFPWQCLERVAVQGWSGARENALASIREGIESEGRNTPKAPGNKQEFFTEDWPLPFWPPPGRGKVSGGGDRSDPGLAALLPQNRNIFRVIALFGEAKCSLHFPAAEIDSHDPPERRGVPHCLPVGPPPQRLCSEPSDHPQQQLLAFRFDLPHPSSRVSEQLASSTVPCPAPRRHPAGRCRLASGNPGACRTGPRQQLLHPPPQTVRPCPLLDHSQPRQARQPLRTLLPLDCPSRLRSLVHPRSPGGCRLGMLKTPENTSAIQVFCFPPCLQSRFWGCIFLLRPIPSFGYSKAIRVS